MAAVDESVEVDPNDFHQYVMTHYVWIPDTSDRRAHHATVSLNEDDFDERG